MSDKTRQFLEENEMNPAALEAASRGDMKNALVASTPGGIERQEAAGQKALVKSATLPKEINGATREQLTEIGFKFGDDVDDIFVNCELPPGWGKRATDHSMHTGLLDERGRKRASIFYKAAFYDRRANMSMCPLLRIDAYWPVTTDGKTMKCVVMRGEEVMFNAGEWTEPDYDKRREFESACSQWLDARYPDWKNPLAYW